MDLLVAVSVLLAWAASVVETLRGGEAVYYDAAVMFIFFLLAARHIETEARRRATAALDVLARAQPELALRLDAAGWVAVNDLLDDSPNVKSYAVQWLGSLPNRAEVAKRVSPLQYVRKDLPPILTIHGDADPTVPYSHATRLHDALNKAGVTNQLLTIPGGKHGGFTKDEYLKAYATIRAFLKKHGLAK